MPRHAGAWRRSATLEVEVPAGIADGQRIRLGGRGHAGEAGAPAGDLYVLVRVREDERFVREGDDLITALDVPAPLAALGATLEVPTLEGSVELELPAGTQPGEVLTLRGEGMPALRRGRHGDLRVVVNVRRPAAPQRRAARAAASGSTRRSPRRTCARRSRCSPSCGARSAARPRDPARRPRRREQAELVLAELLELAPAGVEEVRARARHGRVRRLRRRRASCRRCPTCDAVAGDALVEVSTSEIADDWDERWKRFHRPVLIEAPRRAPARRRARAARAPAVGGRRRSRERGVDEIVIDPGQAFGTGRPRDARGCAWSCCWSSPPSSARAGPLLDVGTGSGVLAIAAARLGFAPVLGARQRAARASRRRGRTRRQRRRDRGARASTCAASRCPAGRRPGPRAADVVLANLLRPLLLELAGALRRSAPGRS